MLVPAEQEYECRLHIVGPESPLEALPLPLEDGRYGLDPIRRLTLPRIDKPLSRRILRCEGSAGPGFEPGWFRIFFNENIFLLKI